MRLVGTRVGGDIVATRPAFRVGDELYPYFSGYDTRRARFSVMTDLATLSSVFRDRGRRTVLSPQAIWSLPSLSAIVRTVTIRYSAAHAKSPRPQLSGDAYDGSTIVRQNGRINPVFTLRMTLFLKCD
jgi:hypothetical protein